MKRKHISLQTKLAATLLALGDISYDEAKQMTAKQIISRYQFHHNIRHEAGGPDKPYNLSPVLVELHRRQTAKIDIPQIAKERRIKKKWRSFMRSVNKGRKPLKRTPRWGHS